MDGRKTGSAIDQMAHDPNIPNILFYFCICMAMIRL